ncbi:coiled-coil domain-containing protein 122 isoform X2 [Halichoeres trimaculatus]|uniref:coiled-coil domain-containing protein 122 isoform X2 n=1 Tax=Halichoeres trimaculatus TaxID=147232 RepID=UPI003D9F3032
MAGQDLRAKTRETLLLEGEMEHLQQQNLTLNERCVSISKENSNLHMDMSGVMVKAQTEQETFSTYREKMETHRAAVLHAASETKAQKELESKREMVQTLKLKKEELRKDLENPYGNTVQTEKREIDALKEKCFVMRKITEEKKEKLDQELELQEGLRKDIEIYNKRFDAIIRRLHCQMSRAQAVWRQLSEEISCLERQLDELRRQQESSQGSAVGGH